MIAPSTLKCINSTMAEDERADIDEIVGMLTGNLEKSEG
jgi:hypothetical protein